MKEHIYRSNTAAAAAMDTDLEYTVLCLYVIKYNVQYMSFSLSSSLSLSLSVHHCAEWMKQKREKKNIERQKLEHIPKAHTHTHTQNMYQYAMEHHDDMRWWM